MKKFRLPIGLLIALALTAILPGLAGCGSARPRVAYAAMPMIVDTDMSSDDIMALTYLLERADVSLRAITVEGTGVADGRAGALNALRLIRALGIRRHVPVAFGQAQPLAGRAAFPRAWRDAADRMYGLNIPKWTGAAPRATAVRLLSATLGRASRPTALVTIGPLTDVALALRASPRIAGKISRIYALAGAIGVPGNEPTYQRAEWNAYIDPRATSIVLKSGIPVTVIPLDASNDVPITTFVADAVRSHRQTAAMRLVAGLLSGPSYTQNPAYFWDPLTAVAATDSRVVHLRPERLKIAQVPGPGWGETSIDQAGSPVMLAMSANAAAFTRDFLTALNHGQAITIASLPASRRITISFDGASYAYHAPRSIAPGQISVRLANGSTTVTGGFHLIVGRLRAGRTLTDVTAVIRRGHGHVTTAPKWFQVVSVLPAPPEAKATWGIALRPGRYALVSELDATSALRALTEIRVG